MVGGLFLLFSSSLTLDLSSLTVYLASNHIISHFNNLEDFWQSLASNSGSSSPPATPTTLEMQSALSAESARTVSSSELTDMERRIQRPVRDLGLASYPVVGTNDTPQPIPNAHLADIQAHVPTNGGSRRRRNHTDHGHPAVSRSSDTQFPLGTREDVQQDDYVSPIGEMFGRAYQRFRAAEETRQAARQAEHDVMQDVTNIMHNTNLTGEQTYGVPLEQSQRAQQEQVHLYGRPNTPRLGEPPLQNNPLLTPPDSNTSRRTQHTNMFSGVRRRTFHAQFYSEPVGEPSGPHVNPFDVPPPETGMRFANTISPIDMQRRPEPRRSEDLQVDFGCKICQEQRIDTISMPCMHASMCSYCAEIWKSGCRDEDGRFVKEMWTCPICRRRISENRKFHI